MPNVRHVRAPVENWGWQGKKYGMGPALHGQEFKGKRPVFRLHSQTLHSVFTGKFNSCSSGRSMSPCVPIGCLRIHAQ